jgi:hypothetical protein
MLVLLVARPRLTLDPAGLLLAAQMVPLGAHC